MIRIDYRKVFIGGFLAIQLQGCLENQRYKDVRLTEMIKSLQAAIKHTKISTIDRYEYIEQATHRPETYYKANLWWAKALIIKTYADSLVKYLDSVNARVELKSGKEELTNTYNYFKEDEKAKLLYKRLEAFRTSIQKVDTVILQDLGIFYYFDSTLKQTPPDEQLFYKYFFLDATPLEARLAILNFQLQTRLIEYRIVDLFSYQWTNHVYRDLNMVSAIVSQSSKHARPGEDIEIIAGLGEFRIRPGTIFNIDGREIIQSEDGAAHYNFKAPDKKGKYSIPVILHYINDDGERMQLSQNVHVIVD